MIKSTSEIQLSNQIENVNLVMVDFNSLSSSSKAFLINLLEEQRDGIIEGANVFVLTNEPNYEEAKYFMGLGVKGYGNSRMLEVHLNDAVDVILNGEAWLPPEYIQEAIEDYIRIAKNKDANNQPIDFSNLTPKEKEVAEMILEGSTYSEIAEKLSITVRTVKSHSLSIFEKCGVKNRLDFILKTKIEALN